MSKKRKIIAITLVIVGLLIMGFIIFYLITSSIIIDDCARPQSCNNGKPCPTVCDKVTQWDIINGRQIEK